MRSHSRIAGEPPQPTRVGFTLVEIVVAVCVLTIGVLALASAAAATVRSMATAARIGESARRAEAARERAFSTSCAASSGVDSALGASISWTASPGASSLTVRESIALPHTAPYSVAITAVGPCR